MNILKFQQEGGTCRFIYEIREEGCVSVVSCENYMGMRDFLIYSSAERIDNKLDIHAIAKEMNDERKLEREISAYESTL